VLATAPRVIAVESLQPGRAVDAAQLRLEMRDEFPGAGSFAVSIDQAAGRIPRRAIAAGTPLRIEWLETPKEVTRGDTVHVEVVMGGARLELEAQAEASGAVGDTIPVLNPVSKKRFPARVDGKGKVSVTKEIL
jgi:flagellar basal body P-ring formation protein FlgA